LFDNDPDVQFYNDLPIIRNIQNCKYFNEESLFEKCSSSIVSPNSFSIMHFNIRSLPSHYSEFHNYIKELFLSFTVIGLSETWLNENNYLCHAIEGYSMECVNRKDRQGGGVAILVLDHLGYSKRLDLCQSTEYIECVFIEVFNGGINSRKNIIIGEIYRPPNTDIDLFNTNLMDILDSIQRENKLIYLLGDFNINLINTDILNYSSEFILCTAILYFHSLTNLHE